MKRSMVVVAMSVALSLGACSSWSGRDNGTAEGSRHDQDMSNTERNESASARNSDDNRDSNGQRMSGNVAQQDREFVRKASEGGQYEVQSSQLALQKTQDAHVRMIAQHMIHDHTQANQQLMQLAQREGLQAESQPSQDQQQMIQQLRGLNGTDFDQKYISQQTQAHKETIALFQQEANSGQDSGLRSFAAQTLPTLQEHLRMITGNNNNMSNERQ
jgi:putative membrane protein